MKFNLKHNRFSILKCAYFNWFLIAINSFIPKTNESKRISKCVQCFNFCLNFGKVIHDYTQTCLFYKLCCANICHQSVCMIQNSISQDEQNNVRIYTHFIDNNTAMWCAALKSSSLLHRVQEMNNQNVYYISLDYHRPSSKKTYCVLRLYKILHRELGQTIPWYIKILKLCLL